MFEQRELNHRIVNSKLFHAGKRHLILLKTQDMLLELFIVLYQTYEKVRALKGSLTSPELIKFAQRDF